MLLCAQYVIPVTQKPIENGAVLVQDGIIKDFDKAELMKLRYPNEEIKDFGSAALTPGFIDLYACSEDAILRGLIPDVPYVEWLKVIWKLRGKLNEEEAYVSSFLGILGQIHSGVTTMADITYTGSCVKSANELGIRGVFYREVNAIDKNLINYSIRSATDDLEEWQKSTNSSRISFGLAPAQVFRCHPLLYSAITDYANKHGDIPIALRLAGSKEEYRFVKYGAPIVSVDDSDVKSYMEIEPWLPSSVTPINYVLNWKGFDAKNVLAIHCVQVDDDDLDTLKSHNVAIAVCPAINAQLGMGAAPVNEFIKAGLRVGISTNAPVLIDNLGIFADLRVELLLQRAMNAGSIDFLSSQTVLETGTIRAAKALNLDDKIGSLDIGKCADIVAIDLSTSHQLPTTDPVAVLLSNANASNVLMTMIDGKILFNRGHFHIDAPIATNLKTVSEIHSRLKNEN